MEGLLNQLPPVLFAFAYGSGVIEQSNHINDSNSTLIDVVLVVNDAKDWHLINKSMNPNDYSSIIPLSPANIATIQESYGGRIWYNIFVPIHSMGSRQMKYGVISKAALLKDLTTWTWLYVAGRLHKPVHILKGNKEIQEAITTNYLSAVKAALLLMPKTFSELDLFRGIASLSYIGDPRMIAGENPQKVINLVSPAALPTYQNMYHDAIDKMKTDSIIRLVCPSRNLYSQDMSVETRWKLASTLPLTMRRVLLIQGRAKYLQSHPPGNTAIRSALATIVAKAASSQSVKGIVTAGVLKCASYILAKVAKRFEWSRGLLKMTTGPTVPCK